MNKTVLRCASLLLAAVLAFGHFIPGRATSQHATLMSNRTVNLAFFYKPPTNADAATVAGNFGALVLTGGDEAFRDKLVANGFTSTIPQYFRSEAIQDPGDCTSSPWKSQVAYKAGDFCDISQNHPDWFLLDTNGNRIKATNSATENFYRMDPGNAGWRSYFVARLIEMQQQRGWSAVFLDNVEATLAQIKIIGVLPAKYPDDSSYRTAIRGFLQFLDANYSKAYNRPIYGNIIARSNTDEAVWFDYMQYMSGAMQERWSVDWALTGYVSETSWKADMALAEKTQAQGKSIILNAPGNQSDTNRQNFAFASYLLIANGNAAFRYSNSASYREVWLYDNYKIQLGLPLGARYQSGTAWRRDFSHGYVLVDPVNHTATISFTPPATATATQVPTLTPTKTATALPTVTKTPTLIPAWTPTKLPAASVTPTKTSTVYNDTNSAFVYSSGWSKVNDSRAIGGEFMMTPTVGSSVTFNFTGQKFTVIYKTGPVFGKVDVYVDGILAGTINQSTSTALFQQKWVYSGTLLAGTHQLKMVFSSPAGGKGSVDAVSVP
jgi:hypothetical protein